MTTPSKRRETYRMLHAQGCFVQPNPWDIGSARWLRAKGFPALATTSAGYAWREGRPDQDVPLEMMLGYIRDMVDAVPDVPVNADFENGYAEDEASLSANIRRCIDTGVAGLSIEDATGDPDAPLYDFEAAIHRIRLARRAVDASGTGTLLTARAEAFLHGHPDPLPEVCRRLTAFADAGADVLFAPGPRTPADISAVVAAAKGKPVNIIVFADIGLTVPDIAALGARRISIGSALAKAAWTAFDHATDALLAGSFAPFAGTMPSPKLNSFFAADLKARGT